MTDPKKGPVLFELDTASKTTEGQQPLSPADAPPVPDPEPSAAHPQGRAMQAAVRMTARKPSRLGRVFWSLLGTVLGVAISLAAWDFVTGLITRFSVLGYAVGGLICALLLVLAVIALRELAALARLGRIDSLHRSADAVLAEDDLSQARKLTAALVEFYAGRDDTRWGRERLAKRGAEQFDAAGLLSLAEAELLVPLDTAARREVEAAARQVALATALVPLALADVIAALSVNIRMIRRVAEIYGGRSGLLGSWRLARAVMAHLVATGAVAIGDDMLGSIAGGNLLSKISRRFGEGVVNGALTARVGLAAMDVCRPLPFGKGRRPSVGSVVKHALSGLFG